jgi:hypothetical protein
VRIRNEFLIKNGKLKRLACQEQSPRMIKAGGRRFILMARVIDIFPMEGSMRKNNKLDMTIIEQLEQIKAEICDSYCKYTNFIELEPDELEKECEHCPFINL